MQPHQERTVEVTDREKNIAIAEWMGVKYHKPTEQEIQSGSYYQYEPDYCNDLNAIHEVEKRLNDSQWGKYTSILLYANNDPKLKGFDKAVAHATAAQRAEALLKTIGKWKE